MSVSQRSEQCLILGLGMLMLLISGVDSRPSGGRGASQLHLEAIKQSLLERLGLEKPPIVWQALDPDSLQRARHVYQKMLSQLRANQTAAEPETTVHLLRPKCFKSCRRFSATVPWTG